MRRKIMHMHMDYARLVYVKNLEQAIPKILKIGVSSSGIPL
jgi:hypothetical protein